MGVVTIPRMLRGVGILQSPGMLVDTAHRTVRLTLDYDPALVSPTWAVDLSFSASDDGGTTWRFCAGATGAKVSPSGVLPTMTFGWNRDMLSPFAGQLMRAEMMLSESTDLGFTIELT